MKHNPIATANAFTVVVDGISIVCTILALAAPDILRSITQSWMHRLDLSAVWIGTPPDLASIIWGLVTLTIGAWLSGYAFALVYNYFAKK